MPASRPPAVWGSNSSEKRADALVAGDAASCAEAARLSVCSELARPSRISASAPASSGTAARSRVISTPEASAISSRCPARPKPVTSVQAGAAWAIRMSEEAAADWVICAKAASTQRARARWRMSAAKMTPVPIGRVRIRASPTRSPDLRRSLAGSASPLTDRPSISSPPSALCPPISAAPAACRTEVAPSSICDRSASILAAGPNVTVAKASALCGRAPIAYRSPSA